MLKNTLISIAILMMLIGCVAKYDNRGFDPKSNMHSITKTAYDKEGYDIKGFDKDGFDKEGYDVRGFNRKGFDRRGYDTDGYDTDGYDIDGLDREGFDNKGYDAWGFDKNGFHRSGYDKNGYNKEGYDIDGFDKEGYDKEGYDDRGFDRNGLHMITKTKYDENGFDINGLPNLEKYHNRASDSVSQIYKEIEKIKKIDESLVQGEFEKKEEFQIRKSLTKKLKLQKIEELTSKIFLFNTTYKDNIDRSGIIFDYSPDDEIFTIRMQEKIRVLHQKKELGTYTGQNAYGTKVTVKETLELSEVLFFEDKELSFYDLRFFDIYSDEFFFGSGNKKAEKTFNVPVKISIAKSGNIKLQIYYKVHQSLDGVLFMDSIEPKIDRPRDHRWVNIGIRAILIGFAVFDGQSNLLHYQKI